VILIERGDVEGLVDPPPHSAVLRLPAIPVFLQSRRCSGPTGSVAG
jgi:hypothetical protein